jgi:glyoxylase-like metal-dependent hydrolase (beta-lactamase superfamily II)/rhodanese-related sulfurtransferase
MIFKQYYLGCLSQASYLIGDEETGVAAIVDPRRDVEEYLADCRAHGLAIEHVVLTHFHADFVAGHLELRDRVGATIHLGARAQADYEFAPLRDGDRLEFGTVRLTALETPGHTPEGISILVHDLARSAETPWAVLTGDTLFIGDVGRPDLMASAGVAAEELAGLMYDSLHAKLLPLPDETLVYPGHGAGSMCGKNLSSDTVSTIGVQRRYNYALQAMSRDEFVRMITAEQPEAPAYFAYDAELNRKERATLGAVLSRELRPLSLPEVLDLKRRGAQVVDVREPPDYAAGHLAGSVNLPLSGRFASWAGVLLSPSQPIVIVAAPRREEQAALRLGRVGFDNVVGFLGRGIDSLDKRPDLLRRGERITAAALRELLDAGPVPVLDVRLPAEWEAEHIPHSVNIPLHQLRRRLDEVPAAPRIVVHCQTGIRSSTAASLLEQAGRTGVLDLVGGIAAWKVSTPEGAPQHA